MSISIPTPISVSTKSALSQVDISEYLTRFVITGFGAQVGEGSGLTSKWDTTAYTLNAYIDNGSYGDKSAEDIDMFFTMNASGEVLSLSLKAIFVPGNIKISGNFVPADINSTRQQILKQAYQVFDALEGVADTHINNEVVFSVLESLGYTQVAGLTINWNNESLTLTIEFSSATLDEGVITNAKIVASIDSNGNIDLYSSSFLKNDIQINYDQSSLNDVDEFVLIVGNHAMTDIYSSDQAIQAANHTSKLTNNISFDLYKDGADTNQDLIIDNGELHINEDYSFDTIKVADVSTYAQDISISDAIGVLRHIVDLDSFTSGSAGYHAADVNNDDNISISDVIAILRHIVDLETIDSFDLIDETGNRLNTLDPTTLDNASEWLMIANGDVNASGNFAESFIINSDLV